MTDNREGPASVTGSVIGIVVSYEPDTARFVQVLQAVVGQLSSLLVIDNSESEQGRADSKSCFSKVAAGSATAAVQFIDMGSNLGLSAAYNAGVTQAIEQGASHVLLLDQDSIVGSGMVAALLAGLSSSAATLNTLEQTQPPITVGPWYIDELSGRRSVVLHSKGLVNRTESVVEPDDDPAELGKQLPDLPMPTEMLISSGSLIPVSAFAELGLLDASLFIDHIDTDWCLRVRHAGHWMAIIPQAHMSHQLGDRVQRIWWGRERLLPVHSPIRLYYTFRNSLWLYVRPHGHWRWVLFDIKRLLAVTIVHLVAAGPRWPRVQMIARGIRDGLLGWRKTRYDVASSQSLDRAGEELGDPKRRL